MPTASKGTKLQADIGGLFTNIAVIELTGPDSEVQMYEAGDLSSDVGIPKKPTGFVDGGSVTFSGFFDPVAAVTTFMTGQMAAPSVVDWKIVWPSTPAREWPFAGTLTKHTPKATMDDALKHDSEIVLDGIANYPS